MSLDSIIDLEVDLASGSPLTDVTVRELAAEFEGITETCVRKIVEYLGLNVGHQDQQNRHFFGDSMSLAAADLVRREIRSRGAKGRAPPVPSPRPWSPPDDIVAAAVMVARSGPCKKSLRGAIIYDPSSPLPVLALGRNAPPRGYACDGSEACRAACGKICEHAEAAALRVLYRWPIRATLPRWKDGQLLDLVHAKVIDGELVAGGVPSCWQCSKAILADGRIGGVWLYLAGPEPAWRRYTVDEFHRLTLEACGLPTAGGEP